MARIANVQIDEGLQWKCFSPSDLAIHVGDQCVVKDDSLMEFGRVIDLEDMKDECVGTDKLPKVLRCATLQDQAKADENALMSKMAMETCSTKAGKHNLQMHLARVRYSFDRHVLQVLFHADDRIDFREIVKDLASELHARIEMKQIGVRDEAGIIGGVALCGRKLCCCSWLNNFESINVKMAKTQKLSLNPAAISGMCGRLKCCLRYEFDQYKELSAQIPREGSKVECADGIGCVIDKDILGQRVKVRLEDERILHYDLADVRVLSGKNSDRRHKPKPQERTGQGKEAEALPAD
jgi:cell fate regulator YaaT (PSP1 superfamily)